MRTNYTQRNTRYPPASPKSRKPLHHIGGVEERTAMDPERSPRPGGRGEFVETYITRLDSPALSHVQRRKLRQKTKQESDESSTSELEDDESSGTKPPPYIPEAASPVHLANKSQNIFGNGTLIFVVLVCLVLVIGYFCLLPSDIKHENLESSFAESRLRKELKVLGEKFPSQARNLWFSFMGGIKKIVEDEPNKPSVFLLLHQEDRGTSECLAKEVGKAAAKFLKDGKQDLVEIDGSELKNNKSLLEDYGVFTDQFRSSMERIGVMIVNNLQEIPGTIAQTFHTFCDEVNPLVEKAVYFFTLRTTNMSKKPPVEVAEETLFNLWKNHLDRDRMDPLIVRMTSEVFVINPEEKTPCRD